MNQANNRLTVTKVTVGSTNPVKLAAVTNAIRQIWPTAVVVGLAAESGVHVQPLSDEEAIRGALNRARLALARGEAELGVGVEGNTVEMAAGLFSTAWVVVVNQAGVVGLGSSGRLLLPDAVAQAIRAGAELGPLMDEFSGEQNTKHKLGAIGILTNGLITRTAALEMATVLALARFINPQFYPPPANANRVQTSR